MAAFYPNPIYLTPSSSPRSTSGEPTKPTLLAFHGSGSNGTIHTVQLARLTRHLKTHFNIISCEAPFPSPAGPGVLPFFEGCGPFKRWVPPSDRVTTESMKAGLASSLMPPLVETLVRNTVSKVRSQGGRVVGLIGFSQGTRVVAGLLKGCEIRRAVEAATASKASGEGGQAEGEGLDWLDFAFGLSVCGSYPPPLVPSSARSLLSQPLSQSPSFNQQTLSAIETQKIQSPTLHIQGKQDEFEWAGKLLIETAYEVAEGKSDVLELQMGHHYPVLAEESEKICDWVVETWRRCCEAETQTQKR
ncbi:uncharacterized protein BDR25DRAFT_251450 [Lindgomyces ingoldianus]|uniref:Uncharacterized protein n=1 Tax=Lindgomyces ingoldianus TaxID=673940 RepID=A0ACB6RCC2_9PLEO|nr:uncharacterized protein BDR25DRAFT_251450 [Lindgomyces ingoldianus]KAF2476973.1 hypothetical protein BDR25DRAFT_251450 [Lindgomyces ingoldianus]